MDINSNSDRLEQVFANHPALLKQLKRAGPAVQEMLLQEVDESNFSFEDWVYALVRLYEWLEHEGLTLPFQDSLGYVSCAAKSVDNSSALCHLPSLVDDFLEQYGCDRAIKV